MAREKRKIQSKKVYLIETIIIVALICIGGYYNSIDIDSLKAKTDQNLLDNTNTVFANEEEKSRTSDKIEFEQDLLNVFYFDVGQADCILILSDGKSMLIDAGNNEDGENIARCLKEMGIDSLDYLIGTHIHEDHLGGADDVLNEISVDKIYFPTNKSCTDKYYEDVLEAIASQNKTISKPKKGEKIELGKASIEIMAVDNTEPNEKNNASIVLELTYEDEKFLFMGDSEKAVENSRTWNDIDVLKVAHHGSATSSSENFLKQVKPEVAIISVGKNNSYQLPKKDVLERLLQFGADIYRTDEDGTIQIASDGHTRSITKIDVHLDGNTKAEE